MKKLSEHFSWRTYVLFVALLIGAMLLCICVGSVSIPLGDTVTALWNSLWGLEIPTGISKNIILNVRLPRVLNVALVGAALSLCGAAMQGLLRNPLADGSTLGVSSGASLGAVLALALGVTIPGTTYGGTMVMAMLFAFLSLVAILGLAYALDRSLSTNSIILIGVIFSMFASSVINLVISFAEDHIKSITFWTMGSLSGTNFSHSRILALALLICGGIILRYARELNAFAIGEDNARHIGVNVKRVKLIILIAVSVLIGVCVSISGTISFVGLVMPHMARMITGPNHKRLLPSAMFSGAIFLLLADLVARTILRPIELSIGVVTSLVGAVAFIIIFYRTRKAR
ncbi:MAG: iron ABC transporter permease [Clostridia bacterium]|nr:iron ABC transporter permease [Clostridia bacterium]MBQ8557139.1 iron ABC transporter permease [Clostridia bacterium]